MAKRPKPPKGGLTPVKTVAIGILAVVLLVVIVTQFGGEGKDVAKEPRARRTKSENSQAADSDTPVVSAIAAARAGKPWPSFDLAKVVASNPFMLPEVLLSSREAAGTLTPGSEAGQAEGSAAAIESEKVREMRRRQAEFMGSLRAVGVDMILRSPRGSVARIGDLSLRVGDVHEGLRVESIGQQGVVFAPVAEGDVQVD